MSVIETQRLKVKPFEQTDFEVFVHEMLTDPRVVEFYYSYQDLADLGVVGRAGFEAQDYDQLAVVRPHVSNLLAIGGTVVGGPAIGAGLLIFSQIFRKPLSTLGESYYRVSGTWEEPQIDRVQRAEVDLEPFRDCEQYLAQVLPEPQDIAEVVIDPSEPPVARTPADR